MTSQPIRLFTNFITFIPSLTFTELWVVSMERLLRVWLASRKRLPFRTPGSVPLYGTCLCSNCWDQIPRTCLYSTFLLEYPLVLSRFSFKSLLKSLQRLCSLFIIIPTINKDYYIIILYRKNFSGHYDVTSGLIDMKLNYAFIASN